MFLYDGKSGDLVKEIGAPAHKGGIYSCSWNKEGTKLLTASGDKTAKIFDIESGSGNFFTLLNFFTVLNCNKLIFRLLFF